MGKRPYLVGADRKLLLIKPLMDKLWLPVTIIVVICSVGFGVLRIRAASNAISHPPVIATIDPVIAQINLKHITYEVFGDLGNGGKVVYAALSGAPIEVKLTELPWSYSLVTAAPSATLSLVTQVDGGTVGCRILVNGKVRDEYSITHQAAAASCTVTAA